MASISKGVQVVRTPSPTTEMVLLYFHVFCPQNEGARVKGIQRTLASAESVVRDGKRSRRKSVSPVFLAHPTQNMSSPSSDSFSFPFFFPLFGCHTMSFFFPPSHVIPSPFFCTPSSLAVTQTRGHTAVSSPSSPLRFLPSAIASIEKDFGPFFLRRRL